MKTIDINAYLHVRTPSNPIYHPNGEKISMISDYTGLPQVWDVNRKKAWQAQASFTDERIMFIQYISRTSNRIFGMDEGVNERQQLHLLQENGITIPLTDSPDHIHHYGGSSPDGEWIAWASNRREHAFFDIYIQNLATQEFHQVFQGDGNYYALKWHTRSKHLLIEKRKAKYDNELGLLDIESGEVEWLTSHTEEACFEVPRFSTDGETLYLLSNVGQEFIGLAELHIPTKKITWLDQREWDLEGLTMSEDKSLLAYTVNEGGMSCGVVYDLTKKSIEQWKTPCGVLSELAFSPDSTKLAYVFNGAANPSDIWELDIQTKRTDRLTYVSKNPMIEPHLVEPERIQFTSFDGLDIPSFYYKPKNYSGKLPVVVFVHGGPESQTRSVFNPFLQYFLKQGYAVCTPNVRGSTGYGKTYTHLDDVRKRMDSVKDLTCLVDWLKNNGEADPNNIAIMGRSYGGFMVLAAITHYPKLWKAAVDIVGLSSIKSFLMNTSSWRRKLREAEYGSIENDSDFFDEIDPLHRTDQIACPLLLLHGANDPRVPIEETEQIVDDLQKRNHQVTYIRFEDEGHFFVKLKNNITAYRGVADFLERHFGIQANRISD